MTSVRKRLVAASFIASLAGCGPSVPLAPPPPPGSPLAMQVAPGPGCSLQSAGIVYLVVNAIDAKNRSVLPHLSDVVAGELRSATPAEVIVLVDAGLDCPPTAEWGDMCRACEVPVDGAPPSAVVVFCDLLEYDPYSPLRVALSMRIRRASDGMELVALQGTWIGTPPLTPPSPSWHWLRKKGPPRPNVDFAWTAQYEAQSATELVRQAAYQCVSSLQSNGQRATPAFAPTAAPPRMEELVPPAPPALPDVTPPPDAGVAPEATVPPLSDPPITGSATSVPAESHPSP
jgi:hypothetical protein